MSGVTDKYFNYIDTDHNGELTDAELTKFHNSDFFKSLSPGEQAAMQAVLNRLAVIDARNEGTQHVYTKSEFAAAYNGSNDVDGVGWWDRNTVYYAALNGQGWASGAIDGLCKLAPDNKDLLVNATKKLDAAIDKSGVSEVPGFDYSKKADADGDGKLTEAEIRKFANIPANVAITDPSAKSAYALALADAINKDKTKTSTFSDEVTYNKFADYDKDGKVSIEEFAQSLGMKPEEVQRLLDSKDPKDEMARERMLNRYENKMMSREMADARHQQEMDKKLVDLWNFA